jgi:integrase/recombinase XerD
VSIDDREDPSCLDPGIFESLASRSPRSRQLSQDQYEREPLNAEETNLLANSCEKPEERLVVRTLFDARLRASEFSTLKRQAIDWQGRRLTIFGKGGPFVKKAKRRVVPISNRIRPLLESYFAVSDRMRISSRSAQRMMKRIANRAAISRGVSPHALRHTFAVSAIQKDISLPAVQRLLGHDHLGTTEDPSQHEPGACAR